MSDEKERFLLVKGKAGMGNRMLSAVTAILYAKLTRRRVAFDWGDVTYSNDGANVFPVLFESPETPTSIPDTNSVRPALWRSRLTLSASQVVQEIDPAAHDSQRRFRQFSTDLSNIEYPETILIFSLYNHRINELRRHFGGEFSSLASRTNEEILRDLLRGSLILHPSIRARVSQWRDENFKPGRMLGVHVRFMERRISIHSFFKHVDRTVEKMQEPILFLATDNADVEVAFSKRYRDVISTKKWFPTSGVSMHQNPHCPDKLQNAVDALTDMYLLAQCNYLVFPGTSTFSYVSSLLSDMPSANIVDVERADPIIQLKKLVRRWVN